MLAGTTSIALAMWMSASPAPAPEAAKPPAVEVNPYGLLVSTFYYNTFPASSTDVPVLAFPGNGASLGASVRQSRFGLDAALPGVAEALGAKRVSAKLEADFFGAFLSGTGNAFDMPLPRLRLFYGTLVFQGATVTFGQDWAPFAPVNPDSLSHMGVPALGSSGNLWERLPQVRVDKAVGPIGLTAAVLAPADNGASGGQPVTPARQPNAGDLSKVPSGEARASFNRELMGRKLSVGASGHVGARHVGNPDKLAATWGAALDADLPLGKLIELKGEAFTGAGLDGFFSAAGLTPGAKTAPAGTLAEATHGVGGWGQLGVTPGPVGLYAGMGEERSTAPDDDHPLATGQVSRNFTAYGSITYTVASRLKLGFEFDRIETSRIGQRNAVDHHYDLAMQLFF